MKLEGVTVPLITPINPDGSLDETSLEHIITYVLAGGADSIFILGSSGEFPNLGRSVRERLIHTAKAIINNRVPLLVGVAQMGTQTTIEEGQYLSQFKPDAVVVTAPYYFVHSQAELAAHFLAIADALRMPIVLYNIPQFVKHVIEPETIIQLIQNPYIVGIKNTSRDMDAFDKLLAIRDAHRQNFRISQGDLPNAAECLLRGADGITLGVASVAPGLCKALYIAAKEGDRAKAEAINQQLNNVDPVGISKSWFAGLKTQVSLLGLCQPVMTKPFEMPEQNDVDILWQKLVDAALISGN